MATGRELLLLDANVVIDYAIADLGVLGLVAGHIGRVCVVRSVLRLSLIVAHDSGWTCVTNDRALRRACRGHRVPVWWGLQLMLALVRAGELAPDAALVVARAIHDDNTRHLTAEILNRFVREIERAEPD